MLDPSDPGIDACVDRIMALLELDLDVNARFAAGRLVLFYTNPRENRGLDQRLYGLMQPSTAHPDLTPYRLGRWLATWIRHTAEAKDPTQHRRRSSKQALLERCRDRDCDVARGDEFDVGVYTRNFALVRVHSCRSRRSDSRTGTKSRA